MSENLTTNKTKEKFNFIIKFTRFFNYKFNNKLGIFIALVLLVIISSIISPSFLSLRNLFNILKQNSVLGITLIGTTLVIIGGGIDLSIGSTLALCGLVSGYLMNMPFIVILLAVLATGLIVGLINGYLISYKKLEPFIATLSTQIAVRGLCLFLTGGSYISNIMSFSWIADGKVGLISVPAIILIVMFIIFDVIAVKTILGRSIFALGGGETAAKLSGINTDKIKMFTYVICGALCAVAALINVARLSTAEPLAGTNLEVDAIAAALVGGNSLMGGRGSISGAFIGLLIFAVLSNIFNLMGLGNSEQQILKGIIIVAAVLLSRRRKGNKKQVI